MDCMDGDAVFVFGQTPGNAQKIMRIPQVQGWICGILLKILHIASFSYIICKNYRFSPA